MHTLLFIPCMHIHIVYAIVPSSSSSSSSSVVAVVVAVVVVFAVEAVAVADTHY